MGIGKLLFNGKVFLTKLSILLVVVVSSNSCLAVHSNRLISSLLSSVKIKVRNKIWESSMQSMSGSEKQAFSIIPSTGTLVWGPVSTRI